MLRLHLDTSVAKKATVRIYKDSDLLIEVEGESPLPTIDEAIRKVNLKIEDIDKFTANKGPGSYTGLRVGAAIINAINWALGRKAKPIEPIYD